MRHPFVDGIHRRVTESINKGLEARQGPAVAGLDAGVVALCVDVERGNGTEERVRVLARATGVDVDVGDEILAVPIRFIQKAGHLGRLVAACAVYAEGLRERVTLDQSAELVLRGEEARALDFLPEVEAGGVPTIFMLDTRYPLLS